MNDLSSFALTVAGTAATIWAGVIEPNRRRQKSQRESAQKEKDALAERTRQVVDGIRGKPGFYDDVMGIAERTQAVEHGLVDVKTEMADNTAALNVMSLRQAQANGTMKRIEEKVDAIMGQPTPVTLPQVKDAVSDHDSHMDERQIQLLDAINKPKE